MFDIYTLIIISIQLNTCMFDIYTIKYMYVWYLYN